VLTVHSNTLQRDRTSSGLTAAPTCRCGAPP
jgi:hypothetical protein